LLDAGSCSASIQAGLQVFLLLVALLSVPVLLLGKPLYLYWIHKGGGQRLGLYRVSVPAFPFPPVFVVSVTNVNTSVLLCTRVTNVALSLSLSLSLFPTLSVSLSPQGYERVRRGSEEELSLMRTHDMEEGGDHGDLSTSRETQTEEVRTNTVTLIEFT